MYARSVGVQMRLLINLHTLLWDKTENELLPGLDVITKLGQEQQLSRSRTSETCFVLRALMAQLSEFHEFVEAVGILMSDEAVRYVTPTET